MVHLIPLAVIILVHGCGGDCALSLGANVSSTSCSQMGSVSVTAPPALGLSGQRFVVGGSICSSKMTSCSGPTFNVAPPTASSAQPDLFVTFELPGNLATGTFTVPSPSVQITGEIQGSVLIPSSGTVELKSSDTSGFVSTFDVVVLGPGNQEVHLVGEVQVSDCQTEEMCALGP